MKMARCFKRVEDNPIKRRLSFGCETDVLIPKRTPEKKSENSGESFAPAVIAIFSLGLFLIIAAAIFYYAPYSRAPFSPTTTGSTIIVENNDHYAVYHEWSYRGSIWTYETQILKSGYEYFRQRPRTPDYSEYVDNPLDDEWMEYLGNLLENSAKDKGWDDFDTVSFVLAFVQSWPYTSDDVTAGYDEYPRYPVETIVDGGGDCEDTSILFSSLVRAMGYGTVLLVLEEDEHMGVGVKISENIVNDWDRDYSLTYYTAADGGIYAYCETSGEGWELGHKPEDLKSATATIIFV
jgi:hypothetical protein